MFVWFGQVHEVTRDDVDLVDTLVLIMEQEHDALLQEHEAVRTHGASVVNITTSQLNPFPINAC